MQTILACREKFRFIALCLIWHSIRSTWNTTNDHNEWRHSSDLHVLASGGLDTFSLICFYSSGLNMNWLNQSFKNDRSYMTPATSGGKSQPFPQCLPYWDKSIKHQVFLLNNPSTSSKALNVASCSVALWTMGCISISSIPIFYQPCAEVDWFELTGSAPCP
jgi:hypothetical protein